MTRIGEQHVDSGKGEACSSEVGLDLVKHRMQLMRIVLPVVDIEGESGPISGGEPLPGVALCEPARRNSRPSGSTTFARRQPATRM